MQRGAGSSVWSAGCDVASISSSSTGSPSYHGTAPLTLLALRRFLGFFGGGPNLAGGISSRGGKRGTPCIFAYLFCELRPCCAPRTEVSSIVIVALFWPPERGCALPPRGGLPPSSGSDPPPSALDPSVHKAVGSYYSRLSNVRTHARCVRECGCAHAHRRVGMFFPFRSWSAIQECA